MTNKSPAAVGVGRDRNFQIIAQVTIFLFACGLVAFGVGETKALGAVILAYMIGIEEGKLRR